MNKKRGQELLNACYFGNKNLALKLIREGADPFFMDPRDGWAGIHYAARWGQLIVVRALVNVGVGVNMTTTGKETPLHKACRTNRTDVCIWLLKHGADPNILNGSRQRPSELATNKEVKFICDHFEEYKKIIAKQKMENAIQKNEKINNIAHTQQKNEITYENISNTNNPYPKNN
jgi:ankyrin repeat protein